MVVNAVIRKKGKMIGQNYQLDTDSGDQNGRGRNECSVVSFVASQCVQNLFLATVRACYLMQGIYLLVMQKMQKNSASS